MDAKIKLKNNKGLSLPIIMFILVGMAISMAIIARSSKTSILLLETQVKVNQAQAQDTSQISRAIEWLEANKDNLNNDLLSVQKFDTFSLSYFSSNKITTVTPNTNSAGVINVFEVSDVSLLPSPISTSAPIKMGDDNQLGYASRIVIYRMCDLPNAAPNEIVGGVTNFCMTDPVLMTPTSGNNSSAGYGGYDYTVSPASDKIVYLIKIYTSDRVPTLTGGYFIYSDGMSFVSETMVSM